MRNREANQGFTLIELLIVILAAVLVPNLLNARNAAKERALQARSSNVNTAATALVSHSVCTPAEAATAFADCMAAKPDVDGYGHPAAPSATRLRGCRRRKRRSHCDRRWHWFKGC